MASKIHCKKCKETITQHELYFIIQKKQKGNVITLDTEKYCEKCFKESIRKTTWPPYEQLIKEIEETNYSAVGRKYKVSDNSIRKWVKYYKKQQQL